MNVEFVDLSRIDHSIEEEIKNAKEIVDKHKQYIQGPEKKLFEQNFAKYCGVKYCIGVDSGMSALELSLRALNISYKDEVITTPLTYYSTVRAITKVGANPVLVDIKSNSYLIDPDKIKKAITKKTKAIMPVHLYGEPADMQEIKLIAKEHNLKIIEDACQAHGALYREKKCGNLGDIASFSFYPGKNLGAHGDGGAVVTEDEELAHKIYLLHDHGQKEKNNHEIQGDNHRLDTIQAAVLGIKLKYIDQWNEKRRQLAKTYTEFLKNLNEIKILSTENEKTPAYHLFVIETNERDNLRNYLLSKSIKTGIHYPSPIHLQKAFEDLKYSEGTFYHAENATKKILSLPMFPELKEEEIEYIYKKIKEFFRKNE